MGLANCRKKQGNKLVYNQDSNAHLSSITKNNNCQSWVESKAKLIDKRILINNN